MNRTKKHIVALSVIAILAVSALTACGSKPAENPPAQNGSGTTSAGQAAPAAPAAEATGLVGDYVLFAMGQGETLYSAEEYSKLMQGLMDGLSSSLGADENTKSEIEETMNFSDSTLSLKEGGVAEMIMFGTSSECTWTEENGALTLSIPATDTSEATTVSGTLEKGILTLTASEDGTVMIFATKDADTSGIKLSSMEDALSGVLGD